MCQMDFREIYNNKDRYIKCNACMREAKTEQKKLRRSEGKQFTADAQSGFDELENLFDDI